MALKITRVRGPLAIPEVTRLRKAGRQAFLIGADADRFEELPTPEDIATTLKLITTFNIDAWLKERRAEMDSDGVEFDEDLVGSFKAANPDKGDLSLDKDYKGKGHAEVAIGEVDLKEAWQIPVELNYGGWNACPDAVVQGAMFRRWGARYGAEIWGASFDTIECRVARPPRTPKEAMELAWEQFLFCEDIVTQGVGSIAKLAETLIQSPYWFFWWD